MLSNSQYDDDEYDDEEDEEDYDDEEDVAAQDEPTKKTKKAAGDPEADFFGFGKSLTVKGECRGNAASRLSPSPAARLRADPPL